MTDSTFPRDGEWHALPLCRTGKAHKEEERWEEARSPSCLNTSRASSLKGPFWVSRSGRERGARRFRNKRFLRQTLMREVSDLLTHSCRMASHCVAVITQCFWTFINPRPSPCFQGQRTQKKHSPNPENHADRKTLLDHLTHKIPSFGF